MVVDDGSRFETWWPRGQWRFSNRWGTAFNDALVAIIMVGNVINAKTIPPTTGADLGKCITLRKIANPSKPKIIEGTAAKLFMLTSIKSVNLFLGANSSRNTPAATAIGKDKIRVINKVKKVPITEPKIPACSGSVESAFKKVFI